MQYWCRDYRCSIVSPYKLRHRRRTSATLSRARLWCSTAAPPKMWAGADPGVHLVVYPTYRSIDCSRYRSRHPELRSRAPPKARRSRVSSRFSAVSQPFLDPNGQKIRFFFCPFGSSYTRVYNIPASTCTAAYTKFILLVLLVFRRRRN
jgi:hypothetical protein